MRKIETIILFLLVSSSSTIYGQELISLSGKIVALDDVEGVHIINKNSNNNTTADFEGNFRINARLNDTLVASGVKYLTKMVVVDAAAMATKTVRIELEELVNQLDEVRVGKVLSGDLSADIKTTDVKRDLNFYDVGIPGNTNLPLTVNERRLVEADHGKFLYYYGIGFAINVNKILNRVSGRTRKLKELVALDERDKCMNKAKNSFEESLFSENELKAEEVIAFFFFAADDQNFKSLCEKNDQIAMFSFLQSKKKSFLKNLNETSEN